MQVLRRQFVLPLISPAIRNPTFPRHFVREIRTAYAMSTISEFPVWGLLPKKETGVMQFLTRHPEYDGRGIVIAIFDSGVDPGAAGLQKTSDGKVKIIERHDCSGAGDVDTSTVVTAVNGEIKGLTGRTLKIPDNWCNPTNTYHIGVKNAFDLYPRDVLERMKKHRKEKIWDPLHKMAFAEANKELEEFEAKTSNTNLSGVDKLKKEDLEAKVSVLLNAEKKYKDLGPAYDCVVFHNGKMWQACLDTSEKGDLASANLLGEYTLTHEYAPLTKEDQLNYSINVHNDGNLLEIVSMCSSHGTHVASIAAACFPDEPEKNGVAPGAQIISLSIGDVRLNSMETGTAMVRAMIRVMQKIKERPIHVINMSYGEHAHWSSSGRICELISEVINKHKVTWVASAGNQGPALCTIGTPPDITTNSIIGVGAYVSPMMMIAEYSLREQLPGMPYTWSSRGPTIDGDIGVTVCAPGGAITSVPLFTLSGTLLMNGTSMAAPHVTGAIAVLLSGMEQRKLKYSPHSVKRALENSATFLNTVDPFAQGFGLLQVEKAFKVLCDSAETMERDVRFSVQCGPDCTKGIHLRNGLQDKPREWAIRVKPEFFDESEPEEKVNFNMKLALVCNEPWVQVPSHLDLMNSTRTFTVRVDPTSLPANGAYSTCIRAYDVQNVDKGLVFHVQVTVVKPMLLPDAEQHEVAFKGVRFQANTIQRHFIMVPQKATWAVLRIRATESGKNGKFIIHSLQLRPKTYCKDLQCYKMFVINSEADVEQAFAVKGELVLELAIAKYWDSHGDMLVDYTLHFHGVKPESPAITMHSADGIHSVDVVSGPKVDRILPCVTLRQHVLIVRPSDSTITCLNSPRDIIPPSRYIYENLLTYNFHLNKGCEITPCSPILSDVLYESEFESQLWMLFDTNKQVLASGDAYPQKYVVKVEKGDYVLKLHVRHEKKDLLEKLTDTPLLISQKLANYINMDVYGSQAEAMICGKKMSRGVLLNAGQMTRIYISPLASDKVSKLSTAGQYLTGTITFAKDEVGKSVDVYPFKYILTEPGKKSKSSTSKEKTDKTKFQEYTEALTDLKIEWMGKLSSFPEPSKEATDLYNELRAAHPNNLAVQTAVFQMLEPQEFDEGTILPFFTPLDSEKAEDMMDFDKWILTAANEVINAVDKEKLLAYTGMMNDVGADASTVKIKMEKEKTALIDAYCRKGSVLCRKYFSDLMGKSEGVDDTGDGADSKKTYAEEIDNIWAEVLKFSDPNDLKVIYFMMWHSAFHNHYGRLVKYLLKLNDDKLSKGIDSKLLEVYKKLKWKHCEQFLASSMPVKYPPSYRLF